MHIDGGWGVSIDLQNFARIVFNKDIIDNMIENLSLSGKRWIYDSTEGDFSYLKNEIDLHPVVLRVLFNRGISEPEEISSFIKPSLLNIRSPFLFADMEKAVSRIAEAIRKGERIAIYGDYDVDGLTSVAVLVHFFREIGIDVDYVVPQRLIHGYGLHENLITEIIGRGARLLITADCGISDHEEIRFAQEHGIDVIVTDHHEVPDILPEAVAVINPKRPDCQFPFKELAGVGVAFYLVIGLRSFLRDQGYWSSTKVPNLKRFLDLVCLGTIGDMVPLIKENRIFVRYGLDELNSSNRPGLIHLKNISGWNNNNYSTWDVAFRLVPRLNACGRVGSPQDALELLLTDDHDEARILSKRLNQYNQERQRIEEGVFQEALSMITSINKEQDTSSYVLGAPHWHRGVIGIVASRLLQKFYKPIILFQIGRDVAHGSGRSIEGFDMYKGLGKCAEHIIQFGGHKFAAGLTIMPDQIEAFRRAFNEVVLTSLTQKDLVPYLYTDGPLALEDISQKLLEDLEKLKPFGLKNPEPIFYTDGLKVVLRKRMGNDHISLQVACNSCRFWAVGFRLGSIFDKIPERITLAYVPHYHTWQGETSIRLHIEDIRSYDNGDRSK